MTLFAIFGFFVTIAFAYLLFPYLFLTKDNCGIRVLFEKSQSENVWLPILKTVREVPMNIQKLRTFIYLKKNRANEAINGSMPEAGKAFIKV